MNRCNWISVHVSECGWVGLHISGCAYELISMDGRVNERMGGCVYISGCEWVDDCLRRFVGEIINGRGVCELVWVDWWVCVCN